MPIGINPHNAQAPVYNHERFRAMRQPLVDNFNITHEQAAQRLTNIWQAQNLVERQEWDLQQEENDEANRLDQERRQQQEEECQHLLEEEQELTRQEEWKNNHNKFLPYNKVPMSSAIPKLPSALAVCKLKKGDYVKMYHFTNKGLAEAEASSHSLNDDAFALTKDDNSHHSFIPIAAAKAKETIIPDKDLMWAEIDEAPPLAPGHEGERMGQRACPIPPSVLNGP
ncbi:hypothetical protein PAXRUDRAFT_14248 [Paxillus rubicundulus Ve08.2h10]|uniref:Uncharacterized protein n=1 Tax=Paxillus rubicundulus Ve08.2h10 TaxID=930991 RepID=A0A0D0DI44_9AGAM|nr:hypothetical protein PAXRUDRAFT_14248 [Paxillus rubicundulus Ve08.2h10]